MTRSTNTSGATSGPPTAQTPKSGTPRSSRPSGISPDAIILPNDHYPYHVAARHCFELFARLRVYFVRGDAIVEKLPDGQLKLATPDTLRSRIDTYSKGVLAYSFDSNNNLVLKTKRCSRDVAAALLNTLEARQVLPPLRTVSQSPILAKKLNGPELLGYGYHAAAGGVLVVRNIDVPMVQLSEAVTALRTLLNDFDFVTPGDEARALASIITPALVMGGWLHENVPADVGEADQSQSGKTYRHKLIREIYGERGYLVPDRQGGVGRCPRHVKESKSGDKGSSNRCLRRAPPVEQVRHQVLPFRPD